VLKKRLIFVLYYQSGFFCLSRNFRLQKVGDVKWLFEKFHFESIGRLIDEIVLLDVSRERDASHQDVRQTQLAHAVDYLMRETFIPLTIGGGIRTMDEARNCFSLGADKILLNTPVLQDPNFVRECVARYGAQAVIGAIDVRRTDAGYQSRVENGQVDAIPFHEHLETAVSLGVGEVLLNSIERDGTGMGFDAELLDTCPRLDVPLIYCGGAGKPEHFAQMLGSDKVQAIATGNLFNFMGKGFRRVRESLIEAGHPVRRMPPEAGLA
jgi:imidazole glycerol-phosphate synthase subunit HisF